MEQGLDAHGDLNVLICKDQGRVRCCELGVRHFAGLFLILVGEGVTTDIGAPGIE